MPSTSVPPSKQNPVGSFDDAGLDNSTDLLTIIDKTDADDSDQSNTVSFEDNNSNDEDNFDTTPMALEHFLEQTKAGRKKASTEKEYHGLLMDIFRKVQNWNSRYTNLLSTSGMLVTDEQKTEIIDYVNDYISTMQTNSDQTEIMNTDNDIPRYLYETEIIWTLFLIQFESTLNGKRESVVGEFRNWIDTYLPLDLTQLGSAADIDWGFARSLILNGDAKSAGDYFTSFTDRGSEYTMLSRVLSLTPEPPTSIFTSYEPSSWTKDWDHWHSNVESLWIELIQAKLINEDDTATTTTTGLLSVMKILMGDNKMIQKSGTFGQKCLATLLYTDPRLHQFNMQKIVNQMYDPLLDIDDMSILIYNMLDDDFDSLLGSLGDNLWMQAHFGHLLLSIGYIPSETYDGLQCGFNNTEEQVTEPIYYVLKLYATKISQKYGMWTEAMECVMVCRSNSEIWIKQLLGEPPLASESLDYLQDLLKFCTTHKLTRIESSLYSAIAKRYESSNDFVDAATNYADADDITALDNMAMEHLDLYLAEGTLQPVVTESKYIKLVDRSRPYSFYRRYHEAKTRSKDMEDDESYQTTVALLRLLDYVPQNYRTVLLIDLFDLSKDYSSTKKQDYLLMLQQLDHAVKDIDQKTFFSTYYERIHANTYPPLPSDTVVEKLRQRFGFCFAADMLSL